METLASVWWPLSRVLATSLFLTPPSASVNPESLSLIQIQITLLLLQDNNYRARGRSRDGKCLITGIRTQTFSRLKVAHIFPRVHDIEVGHSSLLPSFQALTLL